MGHLSGVRIYPLSIDTTSPLPSSLYVVLTHALIKVARRMPVGAKDVVNNLLVLRSTVSIVVDVAMLTQSLCTLFLVGVSTYSLNVLPQLREFLTRVVGTLVYRVAVVTE